MSNKVENSTDNLKNNKPERKENRFILGCVVGIVGTIILLQIVPAVVLSSFNNGEKILVIGSDDFTPSAVLTFWGSILSAVATASLGAFSLWQNQRFKSENDKAQDKIANDNQKALQEISKNNEKALKELKKSYEQKFMAEIFSNNMSKIEVQNFNKHLLDKLTNISDEINTLNSTINKNNDKGDHPK